METGLMPMVQAKVVNGEEYSVLETDVQGQAVSGENDSPLCAGFAEPYQATLLEQAFPVRSLSLVIAADRRSTDPVYGVHRWWARRPPALMRSLLLGSFLDASVTEQEFWRVYGDPCRWLTGLRILDPFVGGGSTLVEAARLGASVFGGDVDPLAVRMVRYELAPAKRDKVLEAGKALGDFLAEKLGDFYPGTQDGQPLHYFYIAEVECASCNSRTALYRNLVLVRDLGREGAVVREHPITVFCPINYCLHKLVDLSQTEIECCGTSSHIYRGTFSGKRFRCPSCSAVLSHRELSTGIAPRRLLAVEETKKGKHREVRAPNRSDFTALDVSEQEWVSIKYKLPYPTGSIAASRRDQRPLSYGIDHHEQLFTPRQLLFFGHAFRWVQETDLSAEVKTALCLALSNALSTNNRLCGYATDYGRLSALFTVRGYSLPALPVELNPLHLSAGRGTLAACVSRVAHADAKEVRRYIWSTEQERPVARSLTLSTDRIKFEVKTHAADALPSESLNGSIDACVFDPPYFDYIAYDELSEFHRAWMDDSTLVGEPLLTKVAATASSFGLRLGACLEMMLRTLRPGRLVAFTYHSSKEEAWNAVGVAVDKAGLSITGIWPIRSDGHMGHHSHDGNCEWDIVVVCRRSKETQSSVLKHTIESWIDYLKPLEVSNVDRMNMTLALKMAESRFASVGGIENETLQ